MAAAGTIYTQSMFSTRLLEDVAKAVPNSCRFFNLYIMSNRDQMTALVRRAERSGFQAFVVTVDSPIAGPTVGKLLDLYKADKISPKDYHEQRQKILSEP